MSEQAVILVNEQDEPVGTMPKMQAHELGVLHRAFSIFIFNEEGKMLLQQRAAGKYHGAHLWTNACCSHPYPGEETEDAAYRRLNEELGFTTSLKKIFAFTYKAPVENGLIEHEYDHVFTGEYNGVINVNKEEVETCKYVSMTDIKALLLQQPSTFTSWFKLAFPTIETWWQQHYQQTTV